MDVSNGPKQFAKHMESKGLKKLKFYCQMCKKQCSDANGFKCHLNSDQHKRQMRHFAQSSSTLLDEFSQQFFDNFVQLLKKTFFGQQYPINKIYMEYIKDKQHIHMNATRWTTLTEFAFYLERKGIVECEKTERGALVTLIDKTQATFEKRKQEEEKQKREEKLKKKYEQQLQEQLELAKKTEDEVVQKLEEKYKNQEAKVDGPIQISLKQNNNNFDEDEEEEGFGIKGQIANSKNTNLNNSNNFKFSSLKREEIDIENIKKSEFELQQLEKKRKYKNLDNPDDDDEEDFGMKNQSGLQQIAKKIKMEEENQKQQKKDKEKKKDKKKEEKFDFNETPWIQKNIMVRIKDKKLKDGEYYKKKAVIKEVQDEFIAKVQIIGTETLLLIDQEFLETIIPKIGLQVMVLKPGEFQGKTGILESLQQDNYSGSILLDMDKKTAVCMPYEYFSKIYEP